jgi:cytochrome c2
MTWTPRPPTDRALAMVAAARELDCKHGVPINRGCAECHAARPAGPERVTDPHHTDGH